MASACNHTLLPYQPLVALSEPYADARGRVAPDDTVDVGARLTTRS